MLPTLLAHSADRQGSHTRHWMRYACERFSSVSFLFFFSFFSSYFFFIFLFQPSLIRNDIWLWWYICRWCVYWLLSKWLVSRICDIAIEFHTSFSTVEMVPVIVCYSLSLSLYYLSSVFFLLLLIFFRHDEQFEFLPSRKTSTLNPRWWAFCVLHCSVLWYI